MQPIKLPSCEIITGDCREILKTLADESAHCCVTSPPYFGLRDYGNSKQIGLEETPDIYIAEMVGVFRELRRVLRNDGTLWLNLGDSYTSGGRDTFGTFDPDSKQATQAAVKSAKRAPQPKDLKPKDLIGIPWRVAFALQADGWYLRSDIIWHKPNPMPESVTDRPTKAHEYIFLMSKSARYYYDAEAIKEPSVMRPQNRNTKREEHPKGDEGRSEHLRPEGGTSYKDRNKRSVWTVPSAPYSEAHFATYPTNLIKPCILAGCPSGGTVIDPFGGSGTTGEVSLELGRNAILLELNPEYAALAKSRTSVTPGFNL